MAALDFHYTARTAEGRIVRGAMRAADVNGVVELLQSRALCVTAVDTASDPVVRLRRALTVGPISHAALVGFFRAFATLFSAGVSISRALAVCIERTSDARLAEALRSVLADVEHGSALAAALARRPADFPALHVAMVRAGEAGGILDDVLERLAVLLEREAALRRALRTALTYPALVAAAAAVLIVFLLTRIVPMFAQIFAGFELELPLATRLLIDLGTLLQSPAVWLVVLPTSALAVLGAWRLTRSAGGSRALDTVRLRLPIVGPLLRRAISARVARMLGTLLQAGVELVAALESVIPIAGSPLFARALTELIAALREGQSLSAPLAASGLFDPLFIALVAVGEETGLVDEMLLGAAHHFERDVEAAIATLGAVIEPVLIGVLGIVVGFIVCSIFIPLYSLMGQVSP